MLYPRLVCAVLALVGLLAAPAHADDMVPVPDVRGMTEAQARQVLNRAGLRLGGSEAVSEAVLKSQFGRTYDPGTVVQQSPPPSVSDQPSWVRRGGDVWLRVAAGRARAPTPVVPAQPGTATGPGTTIPSPPASVPGTTIPAPPSSMPRTPSMPTTVTRVPTTTTPAPVRTTWAGNTPPRPPPPYALEGSPMPAQPRTVVVSGYVDDAVQARMAARSWVASVLRKPFDVMQFAELVRSLAVAARPADDGPDGAGEQEMGA